MGAGLDSTAYRLAGPLSGMRIFEVDHPDSQAWKKTRLGQLGIEIPENLTFVPFDFENYDFKSGALGTGRRFSQGIANGVLVAWRAYVSER